MPCEDNFHSLKQYLQERYCRLTDDWIRARSMPSNDKGVVDFEKIYQEWLNEDWDKLECKLSSLDTIGAEWRINVLNTEKMTIQGNYLLQVNSIVDISRPLPIGANAEADVINDSDGENVDEDSAENFGKLIKKASNKTKDKDKRRMFNRGPRMLQFELIDGRHNQILAIEYESLVHLHEKMIGSKVLLQGPFEVRAGIIHLRPGNVKIILEKSIEPNTGEIPEMNNQQNNNFDQDILKEQNQNQQPPGQRQSIEYLMPDPATLLELLDDII